MTDHTIGVDISKASLDVFDSKRQEVRRFNNTDAGFRELSKWVASSPPTRVVYEMVWLPPPPKKKRHHNVPRWWSRGHNLERMTI